MRTIPLRYPGNCQQCGAPLSAGESALYERHLGIRCLGCGPENDGQLRDLRQTAANDRADQLDTWAAKRRTEATQTLERNHENYGQDWVFITQPGYFPTRARIFAQDDRAHESLQVAKRMERKAETLRAGVTMKGDAKAARQAMRDNIRKQLTIGATVHTALYGQATIVKINRQTANIIVCRETESFTTNIDLSYITPPDTT